MGPSPPDNTATAAGDLYAVKPVLGVRLLDIPPPRAFAERHPQAALRRGGRTSSLGARRLGVAALTANAAVAPGGGLCAAPVDDPDAPPLEIALKGGQMGERDSFGRARGA